jgi:tetratricopeptide (TPR) repeat protein
MPEAITCKRPLLWGILSLAVGLIVEQITATATVMLLSFCAIVKNESQNLERCLLSVKPFVDEMIVVDTGSTDDTVAIAQRCGASIHYFKWCNDFAAARNFANSLATGDWVLTLDADEKLVTSNPNWIKSLQIAAQDILAFSIGLRSASAPETEMQPLRLFRNHPSLQYRDRYHEYLTYAGQALASDHPYVRCLENVEIMHYGYTEDVIAGKSVQRIPILEEIRNADGLSLMLLWTLSGMYEVTEQFEQAQSCYEEAWERLLPDLLTNTPLEDSRSVRSWLYSLAVRALKAEDIETSQFICEQGIAWFPDFPPLFYLSGLLLKMSDTPFAAIPFFEHCLEADRTGQYFKGEPFDQTLITLYPAFDLGDVYLALSQYTEAITAFELALSFDLNHTQARAQLAVAQQQLAST